MSWVAVAVTGILVGGGVQAYGQYKAGKRAQAQAKAQAAWNNYNAKLETQKAEQQRAANLFESQQQKKAADRHMKRRRAQGGKSGVGGVSPLLVAEDEAAEFALASQQTRLTGQRKVGAFESQSILDTGKARMAKARAAGFGEAAVIGAAGTSIGAVGSAAFAAKG